MKRLTILIIMILLFPMMVNAYTVQNVATEKENTTDNTTSSLKKSDNNYLSSLAIEGYEIEFDKSINDYSIIIDDTVEEVEVNCTLEDEKATLKVHGNDNLQNNNSVIVITVTAENGSKNIYKVNVKKSRKAEETKNVNILNKLKNMDKKPVVIIAGVVVFILLIVGIASIVKSHKIDKTMDNF